MTGHFELTLKWIWSESLMGDATAIIITTEPITPIGTHLSDIQDCHFFQERPINTI